MPIGPECLFGTWAGVPVICVYSFMFCVLAGNRGVLEFGRTKAGNRGVLKFGHWGWDSQPSLGGCPASHTKVYVK